MAYHVTEESDRVRLSFQSVITSHDLHAIASELAALEQARGAALNRLIDLSQVSEIDLSYLVLDTLMDQRMAQPLVTVVKSAIVAPQPVHVGFARMYQMLNKEPKYAIEIFGSIEEAETWLLRPFE